MRAPTALPKAVLVLDVVGARAALSAGPVLLLSAEGAAGTIGPLFWRALVDQAAEGWPVLNALCCADEPGHALAALRAGCRRLVLDGAHPSFAQVSSAAAEMGAVLLQARPPALDLRGIDLRRDAGRAIVSRWLAMEPDDIHDGLR